MTVFDKSCLKSAGASPKERITEESSSSTLGVWLGKSFCQSIVVMIL
jgi:hypothetical protein